MDAASLLARLQAFRANLHRCFGRRADALFELTDAILTVGLAPSLATLSLQPIHQRGHGSLYAALQHGRMDVARLRTLLAQTVAPDAPRVFAIDTTTWVRNDAETSPGRGYHYHTSRHSGGRPFVAGWSYSWVAGIGGERSSWTTPLDVRRVSMDTNFHQVALDQMQHVQQALPGGPPPLFVFDGGYDPMRLAMNTDPVKAAILVRIRRNRNFYGDATNAYCAQGGRPKRHGRKFACGDPATWPTPTAELHEHDSRYGEVHVRAWSGLHSKVTDPNRRGRDQPRPILKGTVILVEVSRLPREVRAPEVLWLWWRGPGEPDLKLLWRAYVRRFNLEHTYRFVKQTLNWDTPRVRHPEQADRWTWLVLLAFTQLRLARGIVEDVRLPWQKSQEAGRMTPARVRQGFVRLLVRLGSPACLPKPCGRSPGRPRGAVSGRAPRFPAVKRSA